MKNIIILLTILLVSAPAARSATPRPYLWVGGERLSYDAAEALLSRRTLPIIAVTHNEKSATASSFTLSMRGGWSAKMRTAEDLNASRRNVDVKLEAATYVVSRLLFPKGGIIMPARVRSIPIAHLMPHVDERAKARLSSWAVKGEIWGVLSLETERTVRAETSSWFGTHVGPQDAVDGRELPLSYVRHVGDMNVLAILSHNGDVHGNNWELRPEDGACFIIDNGLTFDFDGLIPTHHLWREPCDLLAPALSQSTIDRVRHIARHPQIVHDALARLQGTRFGLTPEQRQVVIDQAKELVRCLDEDPPERITSAELEVRLERRALPPFRAGDRPAPVVTVADW